MTDTKKQTIHEAIAGAIGDVKKVGKADRNKFDGYDFASIDKFLELVNPICATHGLFPFITQHAYELYENTNSKGGKSTWCRFTFHVSLFHSSGAQFGPTTSMVSVPMTGAQSSGSAQSYALKQFFRGLFMIPTGDKDDADLQPNEQHHAPQKEQAGPSVQAINDAKTAMLEAVSLDALKAAFVALPKDVKAQLGVINAKDARKAELEMTPADDLSGDDIPDFPPASEGNA